MLRLRSAVSRVLVLHLGFGSVARWLCRAYSERDAGVCQNYGPFLGTLNITGRIIIGIQEGTIILTTTHINYS